MPDGGQLGADGAAGGAGEGEVVGGAERGRAEDRAAVEGVQAGDVAALLVDGDDGARVGRPDRGAERGATASGPSAVLLPK